MRLLPWVALGLGAGVFLAGCSTGGVKTGETSIQALERRAQERWDFLIQKQAEKAYDYLTPGVRSTKPRTDYAKEMNDRPVTWLSAKALDHECKNADACTVHVQVEFKVNVPLAGVKESKGVSMVEERWLRIQNQWYHLPTSFQ